jgi:tRNA dimethylallyltransferase
MSNNKIPVIVGGTNYYIESILWNVLIDSKEINKRDDKQSLVFDRDFQLSKTFEAKEVNKEITKQNIFSYPINYDRFEDISSKKLFEILKEVDPKAALSLHPNDKRKIIRSLQVFQQNGKLYSELIANQRAVSGGSDLGGPLRYRNAVILWLDCDKKGIQTISIEVLN